MEDFVKIEKEKGNTLTCPICRKEFKEEDMVRKVLKNEPVKHDDDPFAINKKNSVDAVAVFANTEGNLALPKNP